MNKSSREIRRLYIKSFSDVVFNWRGCRYCLDVERPSAPSTICLFGCLACVWSLVCFALIWLLISLPFIQLLLHMRRDIGVFLFKFRNVLKHGKIACNQNNKKDIPRCWRLFFPVKRDETKLILHENMDTLCEKPPRKNWVLCLKITKEGLPWPVWGSHSLTLIIS